MQLKQLKLIAIYSINCAVAAMQRSPTCENCQRNYELKGMLLLSVYFWFWLLHLICFIWFAEIYIQVKRLTYENFVISFIVLHTIHLDLRPIGPKVPVFLPCGHTFCEGCLTKAAKMKNEISCFLCEVCILKFLLIIFSVINISFEFIIKLFFRL